MIKVSKYIYVHWLTVLLFVSSYITRTLGFTVQMYSVMILHELAHAVAAKFLKLGISRIVFYPFGLCLTVKTRILCSFSDEIILYIAGPLINALIAAVMSIIGEKSLFFYNNLALFILNLLPISQLDGGRIYSSLLEMRFGSKKADRILNITSVIIAISLLSLFLHFKLLNVNTFSFIAFLAGNVITQKRKYNRDIVRELAINSKEKKKLRANLIVADTDVPITKLVGEFSHIRHTIVVYTEKNGAVNAIKTDDEILSEIMR